MAAAIPTAQPPLAEIGKASPAILTTTTTLPQTENFPRSVTEIHGKMAASTDQLALTTTNRTPIVPASTRQAVPAFLNKIYNMVSNPKWEELIYWSNEGDSFYVTDQDRFSKEVLPNFFKHANFASFVRQLNMYGFHKVPHLQQGVLQNSTETELWQFQNPHFQRGQPDLLCLITRKKTGANTEPAIEDAPRTNATVEPTPSANQSAGPLDMTVLTSSLTAIKKHQTSLSTELKTLQESNQHLWNEALAARDRHKKHQDTINKILKFLASVFGNGASGAAPSATTGNSSDVRDGRASPGALVPRKRPRLMIENGIHDEEHFLQFPPREPPDVSLLFQEDQDQEMEEGRISEASSEAAPSPAVHPDQAGVKPKSEPPPTPGLELTAPAPLPISGTPSPLVTSSTAPPAASRASLMNTVARRPSSQNLNVPASGHRSISPVTPSNPPPPTPTMLPQANDEQSQDQIYQEAINKLLSSPNAIQRLLAMVSNQGPEHPPLLPETQSELGPYYGNLMNMSMDTAPDPQLAYGAARLDQSTEAVGQEIVNTDQEIDNLMWDLGIAPEMLQDHNGELNGFGHPNGFVSNGDLGHLNGLGTSNQPTGYATITPEGEEVDIDTFLNQFEFPEDPVSSADAINQHTSNLSTPGVHSNSTFPVPLAAEFDLANPGPQSASFLDEVHQIPSGASDTSLSPAIPLLDDFSQAAPAAPSSPTTVRFPTPSAPSVVAPSVSNGVTAAAATKRGRKRRSAAGETAAEDTNTTRTARK